MKAIVLKAPGQNSELEMSDVPEPEVRTGFIKVRIKASGFNPVDFQMRNGLSEAKLISSPILGREFSGVISEIGEGVSHFQVGDEVYAYSGGLGSNGTYAEYISVPQEVLAHKPKGISFQEAAALPMASLTALQCYERLPKINKPSILITGGTGGVGSALLKLLSKADKEKMTATSGSDRSTEILIGLGVKKDKIVNYHQPNSCEKLLLSNNQNLYDIVIDLVGGEISESASKVLQINGTYLDVTFFTTSKAKETLFDKGAVVIHIANYAYAKGEGPIGKTYYGKNLMKINDLIDEGLFQVPKIQILGNLNINTVELAHKRMEQNRTNGVKLVMRVD